MTTAIPTATRSPIYIVDALNYIFRAYYGLPGSIVAPSGMQTNAILGYLRTLLRIVKERKPQYMAAAFESDTSFRSQMFGEYKATRSPTPPELKPQIDYCRRMTEALGIPTFEAQDYEADDIIGTIAVHMRTQGHGAVIVSGDKDMSQLVRDGVSVYDLAKEVWLDEAAVREKFGVAPSQIPDLLALLGDSVDNIPGVSGVGDKTARQLLAICSGIEDLAVPLERPERLSIRNRDVVLRRIRENIETARMSRRLATICCDIPMAISPELLRYRRGNLRNLEPLCDELGFRRILDDIPMEGQLTLF
jgi:DNA polymerase-1